MAAFQAFVLTDAYRVKQPDRVIHADVTVFVEDGQVRMLAHTGVEIRLSIDDMARIAELMDAYRAAQQPHDGAEGG